MIRTFFFIVFNQGRVIKVTFITHNGIQLENVQREYNTYFWCLGIRLIYTYITIRRHRTFGSVLNSCQALLVCRVTKTLLFLIDINNYVVKFCSESYLTNRFMQVYCKGKCLVRSLFYRNILLVKTVINICVNL